MRTARKILFGSLFFFLACSGDAKNEKDSSLSSTAKPPATTAARPLEKLTPPKTVEEIKQVYASTMQHLRSGQLDSVSVKYDCGGERSGTVTYFSHENKLKLIKHQYQEYDHFSATDQYFVVDESLFFAHFNRLTWSFDSNGAAEGATKDDIVEQRFYIIDKQAVQCLEKKYTIRSSSKDNPNVSQIPNKTVNCKSLKPIWKRYGDLLAFRSAAKQDCLQN